MKEEKKRKRGQVSLIQRDLTQHCSALGLRELILAAETGG